MSRLSPIVAAILVKPFAEAKVRLAEAMDAERRSNLSRAIATRTVASAVDAGADRVVVVAAHPDVAEWAVRLSVESVTDPGTGLNDAAAFAHELLSKDRSICVLVHADLPIVTAEELRDAFVLAHHGPVLAPSHDGGTTLLASHRQPQFMYGPDSFRAHHAQLPDANVLCLPGFALDLDTPNDLARAIEHPRGHWLELAMETQ